MALTPHINLRALTKNQVRAVIENLLLRNGFFHAEANSEQRHSILNALVHGYDSLYHDEIDPLKSYFLSTLIPMPNGLTKQVSEKLQEKAKKYDIIDLLDNMDKTVEIIVNKIIPYLSDDNNSITVNKWASFLNDNDVKDEDIESYRSILKQNGIEITYSDSEEVGSEIDSSTVLSKEEQSTLFNRLYEIRVMISGNNPELLKSDQLTQICLKNEEYCELRNTIFLHNQRLVTYFLKKMYFRGDEDELQEGRLSLLHAIDMFNPSKNNQFSTYVQTCIRNDVQRYRNKNSNSRHVPENKVLLYARLQKLRNQLEMEFNRSVTIDEWCQAWLELDTKNTSKQFYTMITYVSTPTFSLDAPIQSGDSDDMYLADIICDTTSDSVEDFIINKENEFVLDNVLSSTLESRSETFFRLAKGFIFTKEQAEYASFKLGRTVKLNEVVSLEEIGEVFGLSVDSVRSTINNARMLLQSHPVPASKLAELVNYQLY